MDFKEVWNRIKERGIELSQNKNVLLYLFFVGVATIFWFLHSLGKEYTANVHVDVKYHNFPLDTEPQEKTTKDLTLNVSGYGFSLMRMQLKSIFYDYKVDVSSLRKRRTNNKENLSYELSISAIRNQFEEQLGSGIIINSVYPEDVDFEIVPMGLKKVPITSAVKIEMKSGYMLSDEGFVNPDSVEVRAPIALLDTLKTIYTESLLIDKLSSSFKKKVKLVSPNPEVELMTEHTTVQYEINEYIDEEIIIPVKAINFPKNVNVVIQPNEVKLKYRTYEKAKQNIQEDDFLLVVDYNTINDLATKIEVQAIHLPEGITKVYMSPRYVNYTITYE
ncbi:YbbR-like protein [Balneicella halophila]|uniref:YbbR-like protein n=1 Tax=Balneicella halophila TaxID=1537566 RepID=A0A7L4UP28_BALHA|nr:CdaR family protein [Balneicella halophila]PVX50774.1 YbbR-like protein [Balneicella halophila]